MTRRVIAVLCLLIATGAFAARERGKWRVSVGPSVIGQVKAKMSVGYSGSTPPSGFALTLDRALISREQARKLGAGEDERYNGTRVFDDGAWYQPDDSASAPGSLTVDNGYSWFWRLHSPESSTEFVEYNSYSELVSSDLSLVNGGRGDSDEWMPGLRVEASREIWCSEDEERPWGVDVALAFAYYFQRDLWKSSGTAEYNETRDEGRWEWTNDSHGEAQYLLQWYRNPDKDGFLGAGYFGPGPELADDAWSSKLIEDPRRTITHHPSWRSHGKLREYSFELLARPWWEPWEWLRIFASLGAEVSRREFDWSLTMSGDGVNYREKSSEDDWRLLGLAGGGLSLHWNSFFVAGEALWRFGGDDLDVDGEMVHGKVESGDFTFRASIGYEF